MNAEIKTNVIKRNGEEVAFDLEKIINAIKGANKDVDKLHRMNEYQIMAVADNVAKKIEESTHAVNVEDIQDMVETELWNCAAMKSHRNMCAIVIKEN